MFVLKKSLLVGRCLLCVPGHKGTRAPYTGPIIAEKDGKKRIEKLDCALRHCCLERKFYVNMHALRVATLPSLSSLLSFFFCSITSFVINLAF